MKPKEYKAVVRLTYDVTVFVHANSQEEAEEDAIMEAENKLKATIDNSYPEVEVLTLDQQ